MYSVVSHNEHVLSHVFPNVCITKRRGSNMHARMSYLCVSVCSNACTKRRPDKIQEQVDDVKVELQSMLDRIEFRA